MAFYLAESATGFRIKLNGAVILLGYIAHRQSI